MRTLKIKKSKREIWKKKTLNKIIIYQSQEIRIFKNILHQFCQDDLMNL